MKTAVSIPDALFEEAERHARREGKSRSQVYQEALAEYLLRRDRAAMTEAMDRVIDDVGSSVEPWSSAATSRALEHVDW